MELGDLDEELFQAKKIEFKVKLEFDHRFKVWDEIIERNRVLHLVAAPSKKEFDSLIGRYTDLDIADRDRLVRRAHKEYIYHATGGLDSLVVKFRQVLLYRINQVEFRLTIQLLRYKHIKDRKYPDSATVFTIHEQRQVTGGNDGKKD